MKNVCLFLSALLAAMTMSGCDVHEFPDAPEAPQPVPECMLHIRFDTSQFDHLVTINTGNDGSRSGVAHTDCDLRVIVWLYPVENQGSAKSSYVSTRDGFEFYSSTFDDDGTHPDVRIPLDVPPGEYRILAWADHVKKGNDEDLYYSASDLLEVRLTGAGGKDYAHKGNDHYRLAWRGSSSVIVDASGSVSLSSRADEPCSVVYMDMMPPLARYHFVSNDFRKFILSETRRLQTEAGMAGAPPALNLDDYIVKVRYTGYMPCAFNTLADKPVDSITGAVYEGSISQIDEDRAEIAFDHVFVNHTQTSVQVALELYRRADGARLSSTGVIDVTLLRGRYTVVEGPMLTTDAGASAGISPDFNGEFNVEIK